MMNTVLEGRNVAMKEEDPNRTAEKSSKKVVSQEQFLKDLGLDESGAKAQKNAAPNVEGSEKKTWVKATNSPNLTRGNSNPMVKRLQSDSLKNRANEAVSDKAVDVKPSTPTMGRK